MIVQFLMLEVDETGAYADQQPLPTTHGHR